MKTLKCLIAAMVLVCVFVISAMALPDWVDTQELVDDKITNISIFTNQSRGDGEWHVTKLDASGLEASPSLLTIRRIWYTTFGMSVTLFWGGVGSPTNSVSYDTMALTLPADDAGFLDFTKFGGLTNPTVSGYTGDIVFKTIGHSASDTYTVIVETKKHGTTN